MGRQYLCFDIGGTAIKYGILEPPGNFVHTGETPTRAWEGGQGILGTLKRVGGELLEEGRPGEKLPGKYAVAGICISTAGMVDCERGVILHSAPLIPDYTGTELKAELEAYFHLPCEVENDVNCAGLAEAHAGAARGYSVALCLTVGTGIGGALLLDGKVFHGSSGSACEVGYMHLPGGQFQDLGAASVLVKDVTGKMGLEPGSIDGRWVLDKAQAGDPICLSAVEEMADTLAMGIANICYVMNPGVVVLGGGIMARRDLLLPLVRQGLGKYLIPAVEKNTRLETAQNGNQAGMLGAWFHFQARQGKGSDF